MTHRLRARAHAASVAVALQIIAWAFTLFLVAEHVAIPNGVLAVQALLMVATLACAVYLFGE